MNSQHMTENLTIHHRSKTTPHGARLTMATRRAEFRQASPMGECSAALKTRMMS
jgi:hypothetical protein